VTSVPMFNPNENRCTVHTQKNYCQGLRILLPSIRQKNSITCVSKLKQMGMPNWQYNCVTRNSMKNSLTLPADEVTRKIENGDPYVVRIKMPRNHDIRFEDQIRGWVVVNTNNLDDKVLFKSDGMPTYHLANIVDDHTMAITHVIRGEEWLPSAPLHVFMYEAFGWDRARSLRTYPYCSSLMEMVNYQNAMVTD
jgi:glutamyl/glutaminyl-tRNA synthetase